ncbi:MAG: SH3 domain-containing protein [Thermoflexales bacterium]|nr:SH3 domain-containing protein [Thermoflexales bacterium]MDW8350810.1 SH3 domain-containing protein [Anaerolineae bacterium]
MTKRPARKLLIGLATIAMVTLAACGSAPPPTASITSPPPNAQFQVGDEVRIEGRVTGDAVKQVDIFINNERYATVDQPIRPNEFFVSLAWIAPAEIVGTSVIQLKGINDRGESVIASDAVFITIQAPPPTAMPTAEPTPVPTAAPPATEAPPAAAVANPAAPAPATPQVLLSPPAANDFVNVRQRPDLNAPIVGQINKGQSVPVLSRNADGTWYQVNFPSGPGGTGWVYAAVANITGVTTTLPIVMPDALTSPSINAPTNPAGLRPPFVRLKAGQEFANLRSGPDTAYSKVGELRATGINAAAVKGKSANGQWWQIEVAGVPGGIAWVFGQLVDLTGDASAIPIVAAPPLAGTPSTAPAVTPTPSQPKPTPTPPIPASAVLPYSQNVRFSPRDDIGDVPLGYQGQPKTATLEWQINGAVKAELEITTRQGPGIFENCPPGNLSSITPGDAVGKRMPMQLPSGTFQFTIPDKGYYLFTIYVVKSDGTTTDIPRNVIVDCFKTQ